MPSRISDILRTGWAAIAPLTGWTLTVQLIRQGDNFLTHSLGVTAVVFAVGSVVIAFVVLSRPSVGHILTNGAFAVVLIGALGLSAKPDLARSDTLIETASPDATPVILLTVDTLRRDALSFYGSETPTPALDALAANSVVFDRAYSTAPWTYASFTSIHSGLTPWGHGVKRLDDRIPPRASILATTVRDHGYNTAAIGSNGLLMAAGVAGDLTQAFNDPSFFPRDPMPQTRSYSFLQALNPDILGSEPSTRQLGEYGSEWVRNHKTAPFLLWLHIFDPHDPYDWVEGFPPAYEPRARLARMDGLALRAVLREGLRVPGLSEWARARYQSEVQEVDRAIGAFLQSLKDEGIYDRALIVFASDHGEEFVEHNNFHHGKSLYNELVRVPLLVKPPESQTGLRVSQPVSTVAIAPTILDLAGIPYDNATFSAESLRGTWQASSATGVSKPSPPVFMTGVNGAEPAEAVVWENYKFIRWENIDHEELYEFESDPNEMYNLAARLPDQVEVGRALLADHASKEAKRAAARGFGPPSQDPLTPAEERILRGLGYLQ